MNGDDINWEKILKKYMAHVKNMEGYTFVSDIDCSKHINFTDEEIYFLKYTESLIDESREVKS